MRVLRRVLRHVAGHALARHGLGHGLRHGLRHGVRVLLQVHLTRAEKNSRQDTLQLGQEDSRSVLAAFRLLTR